MKLLAVPLFELYDNTARYGPQLSAIPHYLSKYRFEFVDEDGNLSSTTPGSGFMPGPETPLKTRLVAGNEETTEKTTMSVEGKEKIEANGDVKVEDA